MACVEAGRREEGRGGILAALRSSDRLVSKPDDTMDAEALRRVVTSLDPAMQHRWDSVVELLCCRGAAYSTETGIRVCVESFVEFLYASVDEENSEREAHEGGTGCALDNPTRLPEELVKHISMKADAASEAAAKMIWGLDLQPSLLAKAKSVLEKVRRLRIGSAERVCSRRGCFEKASRCELREIASLDELEAALHNFRVKVARLPAELRGDADELAELREVLGADGQQRPPPRGVADLLLEAERGLAAAADDISGQGPGDPLLDEIWSEGYELGGGNFAAKAAVFRRRLEAKVQRLSSRSAMELLSKVVARQEPARVEERRAGLAQRLFSKGLSLRQLMEFVEEKCHRQGLIHTTTKTYEVVAKIIVPETAERQCCYADVLPGGAQEPETLMSHWWGNNFLHLVKAICQHASGKMDLFMHMYTEEELAKTYWLCIFGVNQHLSICGTPWNPCGCGAPKRLRPLGSQMDKFPLMMRHIPRHALAMDLELKTLTRVWVLSELDEAMHSEPVKDTVFNGVMDPSSDPHIPSVLEAEASFPGDKELIVDAIRERENGVPEFDLQISRKVQDEIARFRLFHFLRLGKDEELASLLESRPYLLETTQPHNRGETLLQWAARYGRMEAVLHLLRQGADVNARTMLGWTALHYAAICFNQPDSALLIAVALLHGEADPNVRNGLGRTALEEAILCDPDLRGRVPQLLARATAAPPAAQLLEWAAARPTAAPSCGFLPHPSDSVLFQHWVLRMDNIHGVTIVKPIEGVIQVLNTYVKPIEFGTAAGELVPYDPDQPGSMAGNVVCGALRVEGYIKHRWPLWEFDNVIFKYTTDNPPQHYQVDLRGRTLRQISSGDADNLYREFQDRFSVNTSVESSVRFLYP